MPEQLFCFLAALRFVDVAPDWLVSPQQALPETKIPYSEFFFIVFLEYNQVNLLCSIVIKNKFCPISIIKWKF
jgi:hypothetical protein